MSWFVDAELTWAQQLMVNIIKAGHVPRHIAFIMDGHRRFARKLNIPITSGHEQGFTHFIDVMQWCKAIGIKEITIFTFALANYTRSREEVTAILNLGQKKLEMLLQEKDKIMRDDVCIRFIGNLAFSKPETRKIIAELQLMTENNKSIFLNIALAYSSHEEITNSAKCVLDGINSGMIKVDDVDEKLVSNCMYSNQSPDPDLVLRTSGETRFSDFLLWQTTCSQVFFVKSLWPELSVWSLLAAIFKYQTNYSNMLSVKKAKQSIYTKFSKDNPRIAKFIEKLNNARREQLQAYLLH